MGPGRSCRRRARRVRSRPARRCSSGLRRCRPRPAPIGRRRKFRVEPHVRVVEVVGLLGLLLLEGGLDQSVVLRLRRSVGGLVKDHHSEDQDDMDRAADDPGRQVPVHQPLAGVLLEIETADERRARGLGDGVVDRRGRLEVGRHGRNSFGCPTSVSRCTTSTGRWRCSVVPATGHGLRTKRIVA